LRLWLTPSLAISYTALLDVTWRTGRVAAPPGEVMSPNVVGSQLPRQSSDLELGFRGRVTLLGVF
jgi:hypothetical protein